MYSVRLWDLQSAPTQSVLDGNAKLSPGLETHEKRRYEKRPLRYREGRRFVFDNFGEQMFVSQTCGEGARTAHTELTIGFVPYDRTQFSVIYAPFTAIQPYQFYERCIINQSGYQDLVSESSAVTRGCTCLPIYIPVGLPLRSLVCRYFTGSRLWGDLQAVFTMSGLDSSISRL